MKKNNSEIYRYCKRYGEPTILGKANVYNSTPRLVTAYTIEEKCNEIGDKKVCFEHYMTTSWGKKRWRIRINDKVLCEDLINEPNIKDIKLTKKIMENLSERDFRDNSINCPNCDSHDLIFLGDGQYRCNSCGEEFDIDDLND